MDDVQHNDPMDWRESAAAGEVDEHGMAVQPRVLAGKRLRITIDVSEQLCDLTAAHARSEGRQWSKDEHGNELSPEPVFWEQARARRALLHAIVNNAEWRELFLAARFSGVADEGNSVAVELSERLHVDVDHEEAMLMEAAATLTPQQHAFFIEAQQREYIVEMLDLIFHGMESREVITIEEIEP